jgi:general L-amino acid transport system permease protein
VTEQTKSSTPAKPPFWRDPEKRALVFQVIFLIFVGLILVALVRNTMTNLDSRGIASGFGFLNTNTGFAIAESFIEYDESSTYLDSFFVGLLNTIVVSIVGIFLATIIGFIMGVARLSKNWVIARLAAVYVDTLRNIPLLLQIFFWYFAVLKTLPQPREFKGEEGIIFLTIRGLYSPKPVLEDGFGFVIFALFAAITGVFFLRRWAKKRQEDTGQIFPVLSSSLGLIIGLPILVFLIMGLPMSWDLPALAGFNFKGGMVITPEFAALVFALSLYTSSFIAEIVRAGIMAVDHGQTEAAYALGVKPAWTTRLIIVPQALRVIIPPLTSQYLNLTKNSSLAAAIAYPDLVNVFAGTALNQVGQAVEIMGMTLAVYLVLSLLISTFMNWYNASKALVER